ncbi:hypothetical protein J8M21_22375 [Pseudoalteromonas luteoviolacea]|uniref:sensor histidine kinase n=1 Tax=Pseudoalteromonas luteoviolacea TaxID=43657 RepID=UPI001B3A3F53|nr:ATP-binding protein [Pseudoalteromonas luteoviolacea]MBQ4879961.1 hypothetical protein [Pseudoalteromonas luteoviolacea]MBQ4908978.1 hypothetical protein [Pseudoalteromonas luteoviolacea]
MRLSLLVCFPYVVLVVVLILLLPVPIYLSLFISIVLVIVLVYALYSTKEKTTQQIQVLSNLVDALIDEDYSLQGKSQSDPALSLLLDKINTLSTALHKKTMKAEGEQRLLEKILNQMNALILVVNDKGQVLMANQAAQNVLLPNEQSGTSKSNLQAHHLYLTKPAQLNDTPLGFIQHRTGASIVAMQEAKLKGEYFLYRDNIISVGENQSLFLLTNTNNLLKEKETQAWQSLLRVLSHEVNNSLTPIATISRAMKRKLEAGNVSDNQGFYKEGLNVIDERASSLAGFISSYRTLMYLPAPTKKQICLDSMVSKVVNLFRECEFVFATRFQKQATQIFLLVDEKQLEQVLINLIKNAIEASSEQDNHIGSGQAIKVEFDLECDNGWVELFIIDSGIGLANLKDLFVPMYTTKKNGSGIGLNLSQQIIHNHDGQLLLQNRQSQQGAVAVIRLPIS